MSTSSLLEVRGLSASWGRRPVLFDLDLDVREGEVVALLGPNGAGKSTFLRALVGLDPIDAGSIVLRGRGLVGVPTYRRGIGLLAQEPALFPRRSVAENIGYGLEIAGVPAAARSDRVRGLTTLLGLEGFEDRSPTALSGGERQRVALARTLAPAPALVLLDEPFASVDAERRGELLGWFRTALRATGTAAIHVTHDREEGLLLGDRVAVLLNGRLAQVGPTAELYDAPGSAEVAAFLGYNVVRRPGGTVAVAPTRVVPSSAADGLLSGTVALAGIAGPDARILLVLDDGSRFELRRPRREPLPSNGDRIGVRWEPADEHPLPPDPP